MAINPNSINFPLTIRVDYVADTLAELESDAAQYLNKYVLVSETGRLYRVSYDQSVNYTRFDISPVDVLQGAMVYIQPNQPSVPPRTKYLWIRTGLGPNEDKYDILVSEDGT